MVENVRQRCGERYPQRDLGLTVTRDERVYQSPVDVVHGEQAVEYDVHLFAKALPGEKVRQREEDDSGEDLGYDECDTRGHAKALAPLG